MSDATAEPTDVTVMRAAEDMADAIHADGCRSAPAIAWKACKRCGGKGRDFFMGGSRAPGVCFRCAGSGKVPATKAAATTLAAHLAAVEVERLRVLYRGHQLAVSMLRGGMTTSRHPAHAIEQHERRMAEIVESGKAAKRAA